MKEFSEQLSDAVSRIDWSRTKEASAVDGCIEAEAELSDLLVDTEILVTGTPRTIVKGGLAIDERKLEDERLTVLTLGLGKEDIPDALYAQTADGELCEITLESIADGSVSVDFVESDAAAA
jgi:hypothetical protein